MNYIKIGAVTVFLLLTNVVYAEYRGKITGIGSGPIYDAACVGATSCVVVKVSSSHTKAGCNTNSWDFAFDTSTDSGKNTLAMVLAAEVRQRNVAIGGTGACNINPTVEDLRYIYYVFQ